MNTTDTALPIPKPLYSCEYCASEYSWPADDLYWCEEKRNWVCDECWDDEVHFERGTSLEDEIKKQAEPKNTP